MQNHTFIFFGIAGSGKGTQIDLLKEYLKTKDNKDIIYAGTGEGFRELINSSNYTSYLIKDCLKEGKLMPNFFATNIITNIFNKEIDENKHIILDGYPRSSPQSKELEDMMDFWGRDNIDIIFIEISKEESMERNLKRGREDDTKEGLEKRFDEYVKNVIPAIDYFKNNTKYRIHKINGEQSIEKVHEDIIKSLNF